MLSGGFRIWKAYTLWRNSDNDKYGVLKGQILDEWNRKEDKYPKTIKDTRDRLTNHKIEAKFYEKQKKNKEEAKKKAANANDKKKGGNNNNNNSNNNNNNKGLSYAQAPSNGYDQYCFKCGGSGHTTKTLSLIHI